MWTINHNINADHFVQVKTKQRWATYHCARQMAWSLWAEWKWPIISTSIRARYTCKICRWHYSSRLGAVQHFEKAHDLLFGKRAEVRQAPLRRRLSRGGRFGNIGDGDKMKLRGREEIKFRGERFDDFRGIWEAKYDKFINKKAFQRQIFI